MTVCMTSTRNVDHRDRTETHLVFHMHCANGGDRNCHYYIYSLNHSLLYVAIEGPSDLQNVRSCADDTIFLQPGSKRGREKEAPQIKNDAK